MIKGTGLRVSDSTTVLEFAWEDAAASRSVAGMQDAVSAEIRRRHRAATGDDDSTLVESSTLGYKEGMKTELRIAPGWGNAVSGYLRYLRARDQSPNTIYLRSYQLRLFSNSFRGRSPWTLKADDIERFMAAQTHLSRSTKRSLLTAIRGFYRYGTRHHLCDENPAAIIEPVGIVYGKPRPAPIDAVKDAIAAADERTRLMIYLGVYCGLRRSEIARVHTRDMFRDAEGFSLRVMGKGQKERIVPLTDRLAALIDAAPSGWLFPSWHRGQVGSDGRAIERHLSTSRVGELISAVLPAGVTPHMLRHRFASNSYVATNSNIRAVQELLGHSSVKTTEIYTYVATSALRRGVVGGADLMG